MLEPMFFFRFLGFVLIVLYRKMYNQATGFWIGWTGGHCDPPARLSVATAFAPCAFSLMAAGELREPEPAGWGAASALYG